MASSLRARVDLQDISAEHNDLHPNVFDDSDDSIADTDFCPAVIVIRRHPVFYVFT